MIDDTAGSIAPIIAQCRGTPRSRIEPSTVGNRLETILVPYHGAFVMTTLTD